MQVTLLGPVAVHGVHGPLPLGGRRIRCLLAALSIAPGLPVAMHTLADRVWGENAPPRTDPGLHTYASRLRRTFAAAEAGAGAVVRHRDGGYALELDPARVDLHRARELATLARAAASRADLPRASTLFSQACQLWSSAPLAGADTVWADRVRIGLESERLALLTDHFDTLLRTGGHHAAVAPLSQALADHPLTESLAELLMLALHRDGRHADALQVFARLRAQLAVEGRGEPGPALRRMHERILRRDPALAAPSVVMRRASPDAGQPWRAMCQLPPDNPDFVGRDDLIAQVVALLQPTRWVPVVVLAGPPGVGKSALAVRVAQQARASYPDGQWYVRLGGTGRGRDPGELAGELLQACGVDDDAVPATPERRTAALRAQLADRRVLLVLDDADTAAQVRALLPGVAGSAVLVTSRQLLSGIDGATTVRLGPLSRTEARALLGRLVGRHRIAEAPAGADEISEACSRLPLALRIAGARLAAHPGWSVSHLVTRLRDQRQRLDLLATDDLAVRPGLRLSYLALSPAARTAFRRIGLLAQQDVAPWAVAAVCDAPDGEPLVDALVTTSLLECAGTHRAGQPRYRMHDLVAGYAAELARQEPPAHRRAALRRHLDALLMLSAHTGRRPGGEQLPPLDHPHHSTPHSPATPPSGDPLAWLVAEEASLVTAIERACRHGWHRDAALLADRTLRWLCPQVGPTEAARVYTLLRDTARDAGDGLAASRAECQRATFAASLGNHAESASAMLACAAEFERLGAATELAFSLGHAAGSHLFRNDLPTALRLAERAEEVGCPDPRIRAANTAVLAGVLSDLGRFEQARPRFAYALRLARAHDHPGGTVSILSWLAAAALEAGHVPDAEAACRQALSLVDGAAEPRAMAYLLNRAARIATAQGRTRAATGLADDARRRFSQIGDARGEALASLSAAQARLAAGRPGHAVPLLEAAVRSFIDLRLPGWRTQAEHTLNACRGAGGVRGLNIGSSDPLQGTRPG